MHYYIMNKVAWGKISKCFILWIILFNLSSAHDEPTLLYSYSNADNLDHSSYVESLENDSGNQTTLRGFKLDFEVTFNTGNCCATCTSTESCPWLLLYCGRTRIQEKQCLSKELAGFENHFNNLMIMMHHVKGKDCLTHCETNMQDETTTCRGTRYSLFTSELQWNVSFLHTCDHKNNTLGITDIGIKLYFLNETQPQLFLKQECSRYLDYNETVLPNLLGNTYVDQIDTTTINFAIDRLRICYKYTGEMACRDIFPQRNPRNGKIKLPCRQMCGDIQTACQEQLNKHHFALDCAWYSSDMDECYYQAVYCDRLNNREFKGTEYKYTCTKEAKHCGPPNDHVNASCRHGYVYDSGDAVRVCKYTGNWNGTAYKCRRVGAKTDNLIVILPAAAVMIGGMLIIALVAAKVKKIMITSDYMPVPKDDKHYRYDSFICYSEEDEDRIIDMCEKLESNEHDMVLCIHRRDFNPGAHICLNIDGAIKQSRSAIIILSKNFLMSGWCKKEFEVAITQQSHTPGYKVVVVCLDDPSKFNDHDVSKVPTYIMRFINCRTYLQFNCRHFMQRIVQCLPRPEPGLRDGRMRRGEANLVNIGACDYGTMSVTVTASGSLQDTI